MVTGNEIRVRTPQGKVVLLQYVPPAGRTPALPGEPAVYDRYVPAECPDCHGMGWMRRASAQHNGEKVGELVQCTRAHARLWETHGPALSSYEEEQELLMREAQMRQQELIES